MNRFIFTHFTQTVRCFCIDKKPFVGFGELFPKTEQLKSQTDRRVEYLFLTDKDIPDCEISDDSVCEDSECLLYQEGAFKREYLEEVELEEVELEELCIFQFSV